ncbi:uncharacterized protein LOC142352187 [Convolutriloba macropyga]|uniref:uncharacterized protein LOC142352187 n=1 Tax=Convolutriloba macropyga TaxID=536237 RepID=UPI003F525CE3
MVSIPHATLHPLLPYTPGSPTVSAAISQQMSPSSIPAPPAQSCTAANLNQLLSVAALQSLQPSALPQLNPAASTLSATIGEEDTKYRKLFVGGLPWTTTTETLRKHFEQHGEIEEAAVIFDKETGKSKGFGFVTLKTKKQADDACKDPNPQIDGRKANVNLAFLGQKPRNNPTHNNNNNNNNHNNNNNNSFINGGLSANLFALPTAQCVRSGSITPTSQNLFGLISTPPNLNLNSNVSPALFGYQLITPAGNYHPVTLHPHPQNTSPPNHATAHIIPTTPCISHAPTCPGAHIPSPYSNPGSHQFLNPNSGSPPANSTPQQLLELQLQQHQQSIQASLLESPAAEYAPPSYGLAAVPMAPANQFAPPQNLTPPQTFIQSQPSVSVCNTAQSP